MRFHLRYLSAFLGSIAALTPSGRRDFDKTTQEDSTARESGFEPCNFCLLGDLPVQSARSASGA